MAICANCEHPVGLHGGSTGCSSLWDGGASSRCGCRWHEDARLDEKGRDLEAVIGTGGAQDVQIGGDHYRKRKIQIWHIVDEYGLGFYAGSVLKYLLRAGSKGPALEDLRKAQHYLSKLIEKTEEE